MKELIFLTTKLNAMKKMKLAGKILPFLAFVVFFLMTSMSATAQTAANTAVMSQDEASLADRIGIVGYATINTISQDDWTQSDVNTVVEGIRDNWANSTEQQKRLAHYISLVDAKVYLDVDVAIALLSELGALIELYPSVSYIELKGHYTEVSGML